MKHGTLLFGMLRFTLAGCALVMSVWSSMPWLTSIGLAVLGVSLVLDAAMPSKGFVSKALSTIGWIATLLAVLGALVPRKPPYNWDLYHGVLALLIGFAILLPQIQARDRGSRPWKLLGLLWVAAGLALWTALAYLGNYSAAFYSGLALMMAALILCKARFRLRPIWVLTINTVLLLGIGIPIADLLLRSRYRWHARPESLTEMYSFAKGSRDPVAFERWCQYVLDQWPALGKDIFVHDPSGVVPFRVRPGSEGRLFQSTVRINSLGFRGREIAREKGNAYRIVALGESTTFGCTMRPEDRPWPELLEELIGEKLIPPCRVEVINAALPAYDLRHTLARMESDILPLQPDMFICYHGYNGFHLFSRAVPKTYGKPPPAYAERPVKLLADCEHQLRLKLFRKRYLSQLQQEAPRFERPENTEYARAYEQLVEVARTNDIRLVVANFSLAVNANSDPEVVEFYRRAFPAVHFSVRANSAHAEMVRRLADQHREVCLVNTHPRLDGEHEKFIDLMHFTQQGRQQLAETIFTAIQPLLVEELRKRSETAKPLNGPE